MARCRDCGVEIVWARTPRGRNIPLDYRQDDGQGRDLFVIVGGVAVVVREVQRAEVRANGGRLYPPHRRFCRQAARASTRVRKERTA